MIPTPSALVVLLGAIAIGRIGFGVALVVCYGIGMAVTLTGIGLVLARARHAIGTRRERRWRLAGAVASWGLLPIATATVIVVVGLSIAARGASALTW